MKIRKIPMRTCVITKESLPKLADNAIRCLSVGANPKR